MPPCGAVLAHRGTPGDTLGNCAHRQRGRAGRRPRIRRRDRHGRGLRGVLAPPGVPLHRSRSERFDELILEAVARLEPRWEAQLSGVEFAVEEIPRPGSPGMLGEGIPLARLDPGSPGVADAAARHRGSWCTGGRWPPARTARMNWAS